MDVIVGLIVGFGGVFIFLQVIGFFFEELNIHLDKKHGISREEHERRSNRY